MGQAMILRRGGGAAGLKMDITGGTVQPTGVENRIWIDTATAIGTVTVDSAAPSTPAAWDVYIELDAASVAVVTLSNRSRIVKLPLGIAYQYDGSAWVSMDAYVYLSGAWVSFSTDIPDGDTVTPVDDTNTWLRCARLSPSAEGNPTLAQVVASATLCATLMASANAINYLIRSTTIQTEVLGSATAIAALDNSSPFVSAVLTSNSTPSPYLSDHWGIAAADAINRYALTNVSTGNAYIKLPKAVWAYKFDFNQWNGGTTYTVTIYGSNDGTNYTAVTASKQYVNGTNGGLVVQESIALAAYQWYKFVFTNPSTIDGAHSYGAFGLTVYGKTREVA